MKVLKMENNKCFLNYGKEDKYILNISKDDILEALKKIYNEENIELEEHKENEIPNEAERIVYLDLYARFSKFIQNKDSLKKEVDDLYSELEKKYNIHNEE